MNHAAMGVSFRISTGIVLGAAALSLCSCSKAQGIQFDYSPKLDVICSLFYGPAIEKSWKTELQLVLPRLEEEWADLGVDLISASEELIGREINQNITVHVTLCNTPSRASPVILNMRYVLKSFTDTPVPLRVKVGTLHHELLHRAIDGLVPSSSAAIIANAQEHPRVKNHLHLLAVQKATYLRLGLSNELSNLIDVDSQLPNGYYKRAWEIVNAEPDRYEQLISELRAGPSGPQPR